MDRPILEEQLDEAKRKDRLAYSEIIIKILEDEEIPGLEDALKNPPIFVIRDAKKLFEKIIREEDRGHPLPAKYIRKPENLIAYAYLVVLDLVDVEKRRYFGFKRKVIVSKKKRD